MSSKSTEAPPPLTPRQQWAWAFFQSIEEPTTVLARPPRSPPPPETEAASDEAPDEAGPPAEAAPRAS